MERNTAASLRYRSFTLAIVFALLTGLPVAAWLDLSNLSDAALRRQADDLNSVITSMRGYYANNVVGRILASPGPTQVAHNYASIPGAIPLLANLSLVLSHLINDPQQDISYRFISDYPFRNRPPHEFDDFERQALADLRANPDLSLTEATRTLLTDRIRLIVPIIMGESCVSCHNTHPESPKRDWRVGDVRGIQEVAISQPIATNLFSFKYLVIYFALVGAAGFSFLMMQRRQAFVIQGINRDLETANEHKSRFLANMSHELRTPLNAILGYTEPMLDNIYGETSAKMHSVLQRIEGNGKHLLGLINDVLDLSKIEAGQLALSLSEYSLKDIVNSVCSAAEPLAMEKKLAFKVEMEPDLPPGRGDERRLTQVLLNLVGNAIKFTDAGEVLIKAKRVDGSFYLAVRDSGPGISEADQARLFQEFQQAENSITRKKGGTGLGLAISQRIVEMHGGEIRIDSRLGEGSTFWFLLPIHVERQVEQTM
jgi:signal transduction histidine kinase